MNSPTIQSHLDAAVALIGHGQRAQATTALEAVFALEPYNIPAHNLRETHRLVGNFTDWMGVNAQLSADDDIFRFFANHPTSKNPVRDYLADGWRTMVELHDILDRFDLKLSTCTGFLEFASGHGRFTRHLVNKVPLGQLHVSDVVPGSVDFLTSTLGVRGFYSTNDPRALAMPGKYQIIFVLSLFSHLPRHVWGHWISVLHRALQPQGLLVFSTHGAKCARMENVDWGPEGYKFFPSSESTALDGQTYGCTFASTQVVQHEVRRALGEHTQVQILENHFWGNQDAVMVSAG